MDCFHTSDGHGYLNVLQSSLVVVHVIPLPSGVGTVTAASLVGCPIQIRS